MKGCILEPNLEGQGGNQECLPFCWLLCGSWDIFKREGWTEKERESFGSCSAWEGANVLPWGRKDLPGGPGVGENYTN